MSQRRENRKKVFPVKTRNNNANEELFYSTIVIAPEDQMK